MFKCSPKFWVIEANKQNVLAAVEDQTEKSLESLATQTSKIEDEIKMVESSLEKADKLLTQGTNAEIIQLKKSLATVSKQVVQTMPISCGPEGLLAVAFMENQKLSNTVQSKEIGSLEILQQTKASQSIAEGKGLNEAFAGHEAQFTLTTRNVQGKQCYNKNDVATVEIRDKRERECVAEVRINDNTNGVYNISYSPRVQGRWSIIVKENGEHVHGSPFPLLVKAHEQAVISRNLSSQGKSSRGHSPSPSGCRYVLQEQGSFL